MEPSEKKTLPALLRLTAKGMAMSREPSGKACIIVAQLGSLSWEAFGLPSLCQLHIAVFNPADFPKQMIDKGTDNGGKNKAYENQAGPVHGGDG